MLPYHASMLHLSACYLVVPTPSSSFPVDLEITIVPEYEYVDHDQSLIILISAILSTCIRVDSDMNYE